MKKATYVLSALVVICAMIYISDNQKSDVEVLREQHQSYLDNSPYNATKELSREARKAMGLPPNAYHEQKWELTLNPNTGRPDQEGLEVLQYNLREQRIAAQQSRGVGGDVSNPWIDRGPNNIGGRTRAIMFDPNDSDFTRVFAGGVSGGLWVNEDITDANSSWQIVAGVPASISPSVMIVDPNNSNTFYIGSGESYTSGDARGSGIWKSTDGGTTWAKILGGENTGVTNGDQVVNGIFYINDLIARDVNGSTELYAAVAGAFNGDSSPNQWLGLNDQGLYKSTDNGDNWAEIPLTESNGSPINPNDLELDINNNIWLATTSSSWGFDGGRIFRSTDGVTFAETGTIPGARRTEIEPSNTDANILYAAVNVPVGNSSRADLFTVTYNDGAGTISATALNEPNDADPGITATDYTRRQAFYDLPIELSPLGDLYVGGIDLFRSTNLGTDWTQISQWYNFGAGVSIVHADHHAVVFRPGAGNENKVVFGTDGGVFYSDDITNAGSSTVAISSRNQDYNTVQFYYGAISQVSGAGDDMAGGAQDNGTLFVLDAGPDASPFFDPVGGDGAFTDIDGESGYMIQSYPFNTHRYINYPGINQAINLSTPGPNNNPNGSFINQAGLDKNLNILYSNASNNAGARLERVAEFLPGGAPIARDFLTDPLLTGSPSAFKVSPYTTASTKLYVGLRNGSLLRVDNADTAPVWNDITGASFVGSISDIEFGQSEQELFVTIFNYGVTSVWYSNDAGVTWSNKEGNLPDMPILCVLQNPLRTQELILGTELGVWATADFTAANPVWIQTDNGMSDVSVLDLDLRASDNTILATSYGRGMFTSQFTSDPLSVIENSRQENAIALYPTLSDGSFSIRSNTLSGNATLELFDLNGKVVLNEAFNLTSNAKLFETALKSGVYLVSISVNNLKETSRLVIK